MFLDFIYEPFFSDDGSVAGIFVQGQDVSDRVEAQKLETLRNREIGHRLKNQLTVIQAVVNQTLRATDDMEAARQAIAERTSALARAHDIVIADKLGRSSVGEIVEQTQSIFDHELTRKFHIDGPEIAIASRPALSLALLLHELATNAVKHGALSREDGAVRLSWNAIEEDGEERFVLEWRETGGPKTEEPQSHGAGTRLIRAGLAGTNWFKVDLDWEAGGLVCRVAADLASFSDERSQIEAD